MLKLLELTDLPAGKEQVLTPVAEVAEVKPVGQTGQQTFAPAASVIKT